MSLDAEVGADVNIGGFGLETLVGIRAGLDTLNERIHRIAKIEEAYQFGAVRVKLGNVASSDSASDPLEIGLGGPQYGRLWQINSLVVGGVLWTTTVLGSAIVILTNTKQTTPPTTEIVDAVGSLPSVAQYSTGQIIVRHPQHIRLVIITPSASTQYAAGGWATDMPDKREPIDVER